MIDDQHGRASIVFLADHQSVVAIVLAGDGLDANAVIAATVYADGWRSGRRNVFDRCLALEVVAIDRELVVTDFNTLELSDHRILWSRRDATGVELAAAAGCIIQRQRRKALADAPLDRLFARQAEGEVGLLPAGKTGRELRFATCCDRHTGRARVTRN